MINMLQIIDSSSNGGAEKHTRLITKQFAKTGFKIWFIYPPGPYTSQYETLKEYGVTCMEMDISKNLFTSFIIIRRLIRSQNIECVHSHQYLADFIAALCVMFNRNITFFSTIHYLIRDVKRINFIKKLQVNLCSFIAYTVADHVFTVSNDVKRTIQRYYHINHNKVITTLNSIDFSEMHIDQDNIRKIRNNYDKQHKKTLLMCASVLYYFKGQEYIIHALGKYLKDYPVELILMSTGSEYNHYLSLAKHYGITDRVHFPGYHKSINDWYCAIDIYLHPSLFDPLPRSLLEAMYFGKPIIATNINSIEEVITHQQNGLLVNTKSDKEIADAIIRLIEDTELRKKISINSKDFVKKHCSMETMAKNICRHCKIQIDGP